MEVAVACKYISSGSLHRKESRTLNREVQIVSSVFHIALREIEACSTENAVTINSFIYGRNGEGGGRSQKRAKNVMLRTITRSTAVGQVICNHIQSLTTCH